MITFKEFLIEVKSQKTAELDYMLGDCASFAAAFQQKFGGEFYALYRGVKALHLFVKLNGKMYDVKGESTIRSMVLSITGSVDTTGWEVKGPFTLENQPCKKSTPKKIEQATEYIEAHAKRITP